MEIYEVDELQMKEWEEEDRKKDEQIKLLEKALDIACGESGNTYYIMCGRGNGKHKTLKNMLLEAAKRELESEEK